MANEYVLASDVVAVLKTMHDEGYCIGNNEAMLRIFEKLADLKIVEAEPVVHAHWIPAEEWGLYECSGCGFPDTQPEFRKRCSNCGAHMDEEEAE